MSFLERTVPSLLANARKLIWMTIALSISRFAFEFWHGASGYAYMVHTGSNLTANLQADAWLHRTIPDFLGFAVGAPPPSIQIMRIKSLRKCMLSAAATPNVIICVCPGILEISQEMSEWLHALLQMVTWECQVSKLPDDDQHCLPLLVTQPSLP